MRKSRKNKYYSQNQEGGWPSFLPPFSIFGRKSRSVRPELAMNSKSYYAANPNAQHSYHTYKNASHEHSDIPHNTVITLTNEESIKRREEKIKETIDVTVQNIKSKRDNIRTLLQTEDADVIRELKAKRPDYNDYAGNSNPLTIDNNIQDKQTYLDELNEELIKTALYHSMLKEFGGEYRVKLAGTYKEPNSLYMKEISRHKADITSIRREIKNLLQDNTQQLKVKNIGLFQQYMMNYAGDAGELPRTVPQAIFYKESELSKLKEELIITQTDLRELKTLIDSFNTATAT